MIFRIELDEADSPKLLKAMADTSICLFNEVEPLYSKEQFMVEYSCDEETAQKLVSAVDANPDLLDFVQATITLEAEELNLV